MAKMTKAGVKDLLEKNLSLANSILANHQALADKPQVLIKYMEYRHKAAEKLFEMNAEESTTAGLEAENERLRRKVKDLEHKLLMFKDKYGDVLREGAVDVGSLHDTRPDGPGRDPTSPDANSMGLHQ